MKRNLISILLGVALGLIPGYGAIASQTDWLDSPTVHTADTAVSTESEQQTPHDIVDNGTTEDAIPQDTLDDITIAVARTHSSDVLENWWEYDHGNDPDIPDELEEAGVIYGEMFGISCEYLYSVSNVETGGTYKYDLVDKTGKCVGPMQINVSAQAEKIAEYGLTADDMYDPYDSMLIAASLIHDLEKYEDIAVVTMKYNGASTALKKYYSTGELNAYTKKVLRIAEAMERSHGK